MAKREMEPRSTQSTYTTTNPLLAAFLHRRMEGDEGLTYTPQIDGSFRFAHTNSESLTGAIHAYGVESVTYAEVSAMLDHAGLVLVGKESGKPVRESKKDVKSRSTRQTKGTAKKTATQRQRKAAPAKAKKQSKRSSGASRTANRRRATTKTMAESRKTSAKM